MADNAEISSQSTKVPHILADIIQGRFKSKQSLPSLTREEGEFLRDQIFYEISCLHAWIEKGAETKESKGRKKREARQERILLSRYSESLRNEDICLGRVQLSIATVDKAGAESPARSTSLIAPDCVSSMNLCSDKELKRRENRSLAGLDDKGESKTVIGGTSHLVFEDKTGIRMVFKVGNISDEKLVDMYKNIVAHLAARRIYVPRISLDSPEPTRIVFESNFDTHSDSCTAVPPESSCTPPSAPSKHVDNGLIGYNPPPTDPVILAELPGGDEKHVNLLGSTSLTGTQVEGSDFEFPTPSILLFGLILASVIGFFVHSCAVRTEVYDDVVDVGEIGGVDLLDIALELMKHFSWLVVAHVKSLSDHIGNRVFVRLNLLGIVE